MGNHYDSIKNQLGLDDALAPSSEDEKDDYICKCCLTVSDRLVCFADLEKITEQKKQFKRQMREKRQELRRILILKTQGTPLTSHQPQAPAPAPLVLQRTNPAPAPDLIGRKDFASIERL